MYKAYLTRPRIQKKKICVTGENFNEFYNFKPKRFLLQNKPLDV